METTANFKLREQDGVKLKQEKIGNTYVWTPEGIGSNANPVITPEQKIAIEQREALLTTKAEVRSTACWLEGCPHTPRVWVREVQYNLRGPDAINTAAVSSADYDGPVPGFCVEHEVRAAEMLAQAVYVSRPEMQLGYRPLRWHVVYTDGTKTGGMCVQLNTEPFMPSVVDEFVPGSEQSAETNAALAQEPLPQSEELDSYVAAHTKNDEAPE